MRTKIDINNWKRKLAYETFSKFSDPYTGIVTKIDITNLVNFCKQNKISFYEYTNRRTREYKNFSL